VTVGKHVVSENVTRNIPVTREEAVIERRPIAEGTRTEPGAFGQQEPIHMNLMREQPTAQKITVPREEVTVHKRTEAGTEPITQQLRREEPYIIREGDVQRVDQTGIHH